MVRGFSNDPGHRQQIVRRREAISPPHRAKKQAEDDVIARRRGDGAGPRLTAGRAPRSDPGHPERRGALSGQVEAQGDPQRLTIFQRIFGNK